jgi:hypothetical protein
MTRATVSRIDNAGGIGIAADYSTFHDMGGTRYSAAWTATDTWRVLNSATLNTFTQETKDGRSAIKIGGLQDTSYAFAQVQFARAGYTVSGSALTLGPGQEQMSLLVWSADPMNLSTIQLMTVYLDNGSGAPDGTNYLTGSATSAVTQMLGGGWVLFTWNLRGMTANGTASTCWANLNRGKIWSVVVRIQNGQDTQSVNKTEVWLGGVFFGGRVRPRLILGFDGCYVSQRDTILPDLSALGIPATLYVARHKLGGAGYFSEADIDTFYAAGWAIAQHSNGYATGYDNATNFPDASAILDDVADFQDWLQRRGWRRGLGHACWPYTDLTGMTQARRLVVAGALREAGLRTIRSTAAGIGTLICGRANGLSALETAMPKTLYSPQLVNGLSPANALAYVKNTAGMGMHAHLYAHEVTTGGTPGGDGNANPVGSNYWLNSDWDAWLALLVGALDQGFVDPGTIADSGY